MLWFAWFPTFGLLPMALLLVPVGGATRRPWRRRLVAALSVVNAIGLAALIVAAIRMPLSEARSDGPTKDGPAVAGFVAALVCVALITAGLCAAGRSAR